MAAIPDLTSSLAAALEAAGVPHMGFPDQHRIELPGEIDVELDVMLDTWAALDERGRRELIDELLAEWRRDRVTLFPEAFLRLALEAARGEGQSAAVVDGLTLRREDGVELDTEPLYRECAELEEDAEVRARVRRALSALGSARVGPAEGEPVLPEVALLAPGDDHTADLGVLCGRVMASFGAARRDLGAGTSAEFEAAWTAEVNAVAERIGAVHAADHETGAKLISTFGFHAQRLLVAPDAFRAAFVDEVPGEPIVFAPTTDLVLVAGAEQPEVLAAVARFILTTPLEDPPLCFRPLVAREGRWGFFDAPGLEALALQHELLRARRFRFAMELRFGRPAAECAPVNTGAGKPPVPVSVWRGRSVLLEAAALFVPGDEPVAAPPGVWLQAASHVLSRSDVPGWLLADGEAPSAALAAVRRGTGLGALAASPGGQVPDRPSAQPRPPKAKSGPAASAAERKQKRKSSRKRRG